VDNLSYPQALWTIDSQPVEKRGNLWRKSVFPEKSWKIDVDKSGDKPGGQVDNLGITSGKPPERFVTIITGG